MRLKGPQLLIAFPVAILFSVGCMSARDGESLQKDLFETKAKVLELQGKLDQTAEKTENTGKASNLRLANSSTKIDQFEHDIQSLRGEIDTLRARVETGKIPGATEDAGSEASAPPASLEALMDRVSKLEETQIELLDALGKGGKVNGAGKKQNTKTEDKKAEVLGSLTDFQKAFQSKHYAAVVKQAGDAIKRVKGDEKKEIAFIEAESLYRLEKHRDAALKFSKFIEANKKGARVEESQMRMGDCFRRLGDNPMALIYYTELVEKYPNSTFVEKAKERITELGGKKAG
jgi:TolA-binding protein